MKYLLFIIIFIVNSLFALAAAQNKQNANTQQSQSHSAGQKQTNDQKSAVPTKSDNKSKTNPASSSATKGKTFHDKSIVPTEQISEDLSVAFPVDI